MGAEACKQGRTGRAARGDVPGDVAEVVPGDVAVDVVVDAPQANARGPRGMLADVHRHELTLRD